MIGGILVYGQTPPVKNSNVNSRLQAYAMLAHAALDLLDDKCCPACCAPCGALKYLDEEGILDQVLLNWDEYDDGTKIFSEENAPDWWVDGKVDRDWLYKTWTGCDSACQQSA